VPLDQRHGRERFYARFRPFRGGKKHQPQDSYSLRCIPQVHGAVRDALAQAQRVLDVELNAVTDNPLLFPDLPGAREIEDQVVSAGHFHGMPLALAMSYLKAAIPVLASISERRLNKLVDPATSDGLPAFLIGNEDGTESGFMIVQYTAAALVNDLCSRAHPASVYSIPTSANAEDHVSMGANEGRHVLEMCEDLSRVLALELYTAAQALDYRRDMINAARTLARAATPRRSPRRSRARPCRAARRATRSWRRSRRCAPSSRLPTSSIRAPPSRRCCAACARTSPSWRATARWMARSRWCANSSRPGRSSKIPSRTRSAPWPKNLRPSWRSHSSSPSASGCSYTFSLDQRRLA
jgi:hypothetical protein